MISQSGGQHEPEAFSVLLTIESDDGKLCHNQNWIKI